MASRATRSGAADDPDDDGYTCDECGGAGLFCTCDDDEAEEVWDV